MDILAEDFPIDEVRRELGYDQINVIGISYGTRAGLVYLRRHEASVRSLVLDAVVPLTMPIPKNVAVDAQSAFNQLVNDCDSQPDNIDNTAKLDLKH